MEVSSVYKTKNYCKTKNIGKGCSTNLWCLKTFWKPPKHFALEVSCTAMLVWVIFSFWRDICFSFEIGETLEQIILPNRGYLDGKMVKLSLRWIQIKNPTQQVFALAVASASLQKELSKYSSYK